MKNLLIVASLLAASSAVAADNSFYRCSNGNGERLIEVIYPQGTPVPCEVAYTKAEGREVLWRAANTEGFCEQKAAEFAEKQQSWGWQCELEQRPAIAQPIELQGVEKEVHVLSPDDMPEPVQLPEITDEVEETVVETIETQSQAIVSDAEAVVEPVVEQVVETVEDKVMTVSEAVSTQ
ncbi:hypothetical protein [Thaumasiovibrio subtropicus]|uniref:hypothetical protein n=1 Tax=Thaumasiovibrio subtropicus TaxID=1891207 RepID=UPI00192D0897|nr:hypothetical protein [Thaumasiovibrio subtropicus]